MLTQMVDCLIPQIRDEIETVLDNYPHHPYRQAFAAPELRQRLIADIVERLSLMPSLPNLAIEKTSPLLKRELQIVIPEAIHYLMLDKAEWISQHIPQQNLGNFAPSNWFG